jgi:hypothetical protein
MSARVRSESAGCEIEGANQAFVQRPNASGQALRETPRRTWRYMAASMLARPQTTWSYLRSLRSTASRGRSANASLHPFVDPLPAGHAATAPELTRQKFPEDSSPEHEQNPGKGCSVIDARPTSLQVQNMYRKMSFDKGQELVGQQRFGHDISPAKNTLAILTLPVATGSTRPITVVQRLDAMLYLVVIWRTSCFGILLVEDPRP